MTRKKAVEFLYSWQYQGGDSFTCRLYGLMQVADPSSLRQLKKTFPTEHTVWQEWKSSDQMEFFKKHGYELRRKGKN